MIDQIRSDSSPPSWSAQEMREIAADWIDAWNMHDLERIMAHYAADVEFTANTVVSRWKRPGGSLKGKGELRKHFCRGIELVPNLHFQMEQVFTSPNGYAVLYRRENGNSAIDTVRLDRFGLAVSVTAYYAASQA